MLAIVGQDRQIQSFWLRICVGAWLTIGAVVGASGQWTVVNLHPSGAESSIAWGVGDGFQVGQAKYGDYFHASLWNGTPQSWVDMSPGGAPSVLLGAADGQQVGFANGGAGVWSGTSASFVDLNPPGRPGSKAQGCGGGQQVGTVSVGGASHAALWSGTAGSWVDLHPTGYDTSECFGVYGGQQVGCAEQWASQDGAHAALWSGTKESFVDLNPAGRHFSMANAIYGNQQGGYASGFNDPSHAALWTGTAASYVNMEPSGATGSIISAMHLGQQAGEADFGNGENAGIWCGTPQSWVNLHQFVPTDFSTTSAYGIWHDESGVTYVAGRGYNRTTGRYEALLWIASNLRSPSSYSPYRGIPISGGLAELLASDDQWLIVQNDWTLGRQDSPITINVDAVAPYPVVSSLKLKLESQVTGPGIQQTACLFDFTANDWVSVDSRTAPLNSDLEITIPTSNPNRFIDPNTRAMRAQIRYRQIMATGTKAWRAKVDQVQWTLMP